MTMTNQEIFDTVYKGIIAQGGGSHEGSQCVYRHPENGRKCAAGWLIPDELYLPAFEFKNVSKIVSEHHQLTTLWSRAQDSFVYQCQKVHDQSVYDSATLSDTDSYSMVYSDEKFLEIFKTKMAVLALTYNLVVPEMLK